MVQENIQTLVKVTEIPEGLEGQRHRKILRVLYVPSLL